MTIVKYIIGIDIGTGSTKAVAMNIKGKIIADSQIYYTTQAPHPGYAEQDPELIWKAFEDCIKKIIAAVNYPPVSISFSSAMHGVIAVNKQNRPITHLITLSLIHISEPTRQA